MKTKLTLVTLIAMLAMLIPTGTLFANGNAEVVGPFVWNTQIFNNGTLAGTPTITRLDAGISFNWGLGSPGLGIANDNFSGRWTTTQSLTAGTYRFSVLADDGVRLYVDGKIYLNTFDSTRPGETLKAEVSLNAGSHSIQVDYREITQTAYLYLTIERTSVAPPPVVNPPAGPAMGKVNTNGLNVHAGPGYSYNVVVLAFKDWSMTLLGRNREATWLKVQTHDGKIGWVEVTHITTTYPVSALPIVDGTQPGPKPSTPLPSDPQTRRHVVQPGETLYRIALKYGVNMTAIARVNGLTDLNLIYAGQVLLIP